MLCLNQKHFSANESNFLVKPKQTNAKKCTSSRDKLKKGWGSSLLVEWSYQKTLINILYTHVQIVEEALTDNYFAEHVMTVEPKLISKSIRVITRADATEKLQS